MAGESPRREFYVATPEEIRSGQTSDIYFFRTLDVLKKAGKHRTKVLMETTVQTLPDAWPWAVLSGVEEAVNLLRGKAIDLWALPEGTLFAAKTPRGIPVPVLTIEGPYAEFCIFETPVLGFLCESSGIATKAARVRAAAGDRRVPLRGVTIHLVDWPGAEPAILAIHGSGGIAHNFGALAERLAPTNRLVELDLRGHKDAKIYVSGGLDETSIPALAEAGADGFGVGTSLSNAPTVDFAMDIVEREGKPAAKRGKFGGRKEPLRCGKCGTLEIGATKCPACGGKMAPALVKYLSKGKPAAKLPGPDEIRKYVLSQLVTRAA